VAGGIVLFLAAVVSIALAHSWRLESQRQAAQTPLRPDPRVKTARAKQPGATLAIALALVSGIALSIFPRVLSEATSGENGLAPYSAVLLLSITALLSSPFYVLFFITFPITAASASGGNYLSGNVKQHLLGIGGGLLWTVGMLSALLAAGAPSAAAWGLLAWHEFRGANDRVRMMVTGTLVLFLSGLGLMAFAVSGAK
jgi:glucose uptake protein